MKKLAIIGLCALPCFVFANGEHHSNTNVTNVTNNTTINNIYNADGVALALAASGLHFDSNVVGAQMGIGGGIYKDQYGKEQTGLAMGLAQRSCTGSHCGLVAVSFGASEGGGTGLSLSYTWKM